MAAPVGTVSGIYAALIATKPLTNLAGLVTKLGIENRDLNQAPPFLCMWPVGGPHRTGWVRAGADQREKLGSRPFGTRELTLGFRCLAKSTNGSDVASEFDAAEDLMRRVAAGLRAIGFGSHKPGRESWLDQEGAGIMQYGRGIDFFVTVEAPLYNYDDDQGVAVAIVEQVNATLSEGPHDSGTVGVPSNPGPQPP